MIIKPPNADCFVEQIEELLGDYVFDFQAEILTKAIARLPERRAAYEGKVERDEALGALSDAVKESGLSWQEQAAVFRRLRQDYLEGKS